MNFGDDIGGLGGREGETGVILWNSQNTEIIRK